MEMEKNMKNLMVRNYYLKENIKTGKEMEKGKNIIIMLL